MSINESLDAPQIATMRRGDIDGLRIDYSDYLRDAETVSSIVSVTITGVSTAAAVVSSAAPSTGALTILGQSVGAGKAVTFTLTIASTATAGPYTAEIRSLTSDTRTAYRRVGFSVVE